MIMTLFFSCTLFGTLDRLLTGTFFPYVMQVEAGLLMKSYTFLPLCIYHFFFFFFFFYYLKSSLHFTDMNDIELVKKAYVGFPRKSIIFPCYREILPIHVHCMWLAESLNFNLFPAVESLTNRGHLNKRSRTELYFSGAGRGI